jgi:Mn2+/Fe2+ NRAMP family transporter
MSPKEPWWRKLGPGLITGAADDDPSGIASYSQGGAQFGFNIAWTVPIMEFGVNAVRREPWNKGKVVGQFFGQTRDQPNVGS